MNENISYQTDVDKVVAIGDTTTAEGNTIIEATDKLLNNED